MSEEFVYVNITSEGARLNPQTLDDERHATNMFLMWASNDTVMQLQVMSTNDRVKYYVNTANGQEWNQEKAITVKYGPLFGKIPWSEAGFTNERQAERYFNRYISVVPDRFIPNVDGENVLLFSRQRALDIMRNANLPKIQPEATWVGVISGRTRFGYFVNVGGWQTWLPLGLVDHSVVKPYSLEFGEMVDVKVTQTITEGRRRRVIVSRKDARPNPFDLHNMKYSTGVSYPAEIASVSGRTGFAILPDGVRVRIRQRDDARETLRTGSKVKVKLKTRLQDEKIFMGEIERVLV